MAPPKRKQEEIIDDPSEISDIFLKSNEMVDYKVKGGKTSLLTKVTSAIRAHKRPTQFQEIQKYCKDEYEYENNEALLHALEQLTNVGYLVNVKGKGSYWVTDDEEKDAAANSQLKIEDIKIGQGNVAAIGFFARVDYKTYLCSDLELVESDAAFEFIIGNNDFVKGIDRALIGMREGGRRRITVPSTLAYGKKGMEPDIPPDADVIFDIKLCQTYLPSDDDSD